METTHTNKIRRITGNALIIFAACMLVFAAAVKFAQAPPVVKEMAEVGISGGRFTLVAALELASALLFLVPRTRSVGLLMLSAFLGGAIEAHVQADHLPDALGPAVFLAVCWLGAWLRHPGVLWSFGGKRASGLVEIHQASGAYQSTQG